MLTPLAGLLQAALILLTAAAAYFDLRTRTIPNWLTVSGCVVGLSMNAALGGFGGLRASAYGVGLGLLLYFPLWLLGARGAGDVKLLAAVGSVVGPANTVGIALLSALLGGVLAVGMVLWQGVGLKTLANVVMILRSLVRLKKPERTLSTTGALSLPHGPVIFLAAFAEILVLQ